MATATSTKRTTGRRTAPARRRASGTITGINHMVIICKDMEETLQFYCGILGLKVKVSLTSTTNRGGTLKPTPREYKRFYWLDAGNGDGLAFLEVPEKDTTAESSYFNVLWPVPRTGPPVPRKVDHLALNVETLADLKAVRRRLQKAGWPVSEVQDLPEAPFVHSIYFYDPNGMPLEVATYNFGGSEWRGRKEQDWYKDDGPPPYIASHSGRSWKVPTAWHRGTPKR